MEATGKTIMDQGVLQNLLDGRVDVHGSTSNNRWGHITSV